MPHDRTLIIGLIRKEKPAKNYIPQEAYIEYCRDRYMPNETCSKLRTIHKMTENPVNTPIPKKKAKCLKIVTTADHDIERVRRILLKFSPEFLILESKTKTCNYKTLHIAQSLRKDGCRDVGMKFYKGELLKVQMSVNGTPVEFQNGAGATMSDIDRKSVG